MAKDGNLQELSETPDTKDGNLHSGLSKPQHLVFFHKLYFHDLFDRSGEILKISKH